MVESCIRWFGHVWRGLVEASIRRVDQIEYNPIVRVKRRPRKAINKTIKYIEVNGLSLGILHDMVLW